MSESSDDGVRASVNGCDRQVSTTTCSEGDDNEDSPDRSVASAVNGRQRVLKKSVSFNDHIDRTLFQANQSVSSMHAALKNRRRRARKRDQKQEQREQRRRRRSSGSFSLEESSDDQTVHVHAERDGENCQLSAESSAVVDDCCSSFHVTSDKADCLYSHTISDGTEIVNEKVSSTQDVHGSEFSSGNKDAHENEKPEQDELQKCKHTSDKAESEDYNYSDTDRTKTSLVEGSADRENNDGLNTTDACDNPSLLHALCNDEKCELEMGSVNETNDASLADVNGSQLAVLCSADSAVEVLKSSRSNDSTASVAGYESRSSENMAVLNMCCLCDLDVD